MSAGHVRTLSILGREYAIRTTTEGEAALQQAAMLLEERLEEHRQRFPRAGSHELLVLTALNLCVPLLEQQQRLQEAEQRLQACVARLSAAAGA
ncbi:cell division protein ZapA [Pseudomonas sp. NW5]|uniref:cell division protein ZapA n=1 Tax=Pseudomonas sp. NW5 TaxID=2934934 RepID=UPI00202086DD|nr:cell division protein ZapA [Pseudomonas sp. NW5]MCL7462068.1 cell division protein ZapA [Pseudomonas sp. NW5]